MKRKYCGAARLSGYWKSYPCGALATLPAEKPRWCPNHTPEAIAVHEARAERRKRVRQAKRKGAGL